MEYRKLISFGKSSYVVSLPKSWVTHNKLKKGDLIYFEENGGNIILNAQESHLPEKEHSIVINVDQKDLKQVKREIISAYINNNKTITLLGDEIKTQAKDFQRIIQSLVALEVMEQTPRKIVAKDFLNLQDVSTSTILRKIDVIIRSMLEDCGRMFEEDNYESIIDRDDDVNKLTFLMFRIMKYGLQNHSYLLNQLKMPAVDLLHLWWLIFELESIGDDTKRIARNMRKIQFDKKQQQEYLQIIHDLKELYLKMMKAYYETDLNAVHVSINERENWLERCDKFFQKHKPVENVAFLVYHTKEAVVHIIHIGRLLYQLKTTQE